MLVQSNFHSMFECILLTDNHVLNLLFVPTISPEASSLLSHKSHPPFCSYFHVIHTSVLSFSMCFLVYRKNIYILQFIRFYMSYYFIYIFKILLKSELKHQNFIIMYKEAKKENSAYIHMKRNSAV